MMNTSFSPPEVFRSLCLISSHVTLYPQPLQDEVIFYSITCNHKKPCYLLVITLHFHIDNLVINDVFNNQNLKFNPAPETES